MDSMRNRRFGCLYEIYAIYTWVSAQVTSFELGQ